MKTDGTEEQRQRKPERRRQRTVNMSGTVFLIFINLSLEIILYHRIFHLYVFVFYSTEEQGERNRNGERERRRNLRQGQHEDRRCSGKIKFRALLAKFV